MAVEAWLDNDRQFHKNVYCRLANKRLMGLLQQFYNNTLRYLRLDASLYERRVQLQQEHWAIYEACRQKDVDAAVRLTVQHLEGERDGLWAYLKRV